MRKVILFLLLLNLNFVLYSLGINENSYTKIDSTELVNNKKKYYDKDIQLNIILCQTHETAPCFLYYPDFDIKKYSSISAYKVSFILDNNKIKYIGRFHTGNQRYKNGNVYILKAYGQLKKVKYPLGYENDVFYSHYEKVIDQNYYNERLNKLEKESDYKIYFALINNDIKKGIVKELLIDNHKKVSKNCLFVFFPILINELDEMKLNELNVEYAQKIYEIIFNKISDEIIFCLLELLPKIHNNIWIYKYIYGMGNIYEIEELLNTNLNDNFYIIII